MILTLDSRLKLNEKQNGRPKGEDENEDVCAMAGEAVNAECRSRPPGSFSQPFTKEVVDVLIK